MVFAELLSIVLLALLLLVVVGWWRATSKWSEKLLRAEKALAEVNVLLEEKERKLQELDLKQDFRTLAGEVLEEKAAQFNRVQETQLRFMLEPVQQQINQFRQDLDVRLKYDAGDRISLREQIRQMMELNHTLSEQANSLTNALRGQNKTQGNWGEMILESILEHAGLQKQVHYFVQERHENLEGKLIQPDVIVRYPDKRAVVIDSKVSLLAYEQWCNAATKEDRDESARNLVRSMRAHADGLSVRSYQDVVNSLDFVMMFVPVEGAYIAALQTDPALWQYTYSKKVLLISPTNLLAAMKLIYDIWQNDAIHTHALEIAERAGRMYDKLAGFVENVDKVGAQLDKAKQQWEDARKQLSSGKGNLLSQAEQLRQLGIKNNKRLPEAGDV